MSDSPQCRICLADIKKVSSLKVVRPCQCRGSIQYVHQLCLKQWVLRSRKLTCSVCLYKYQIHRKTEPFQIVFRKLKSKKSLRRLQIRGLEYGFWVMMIYIFFSNIFCVHKEHVIRVIQENENVTNMGVQKPAFLLAMLMLVWMVGMIKYSYFLFELFIKDLKWCRRLRYKRRFVDCNINKGKDISNPEESTLFSFSPTTTNGILEQ